MRLYPCYSDFFASLKGTEVILTPNQRLSRFVQQQYDLLQLSFGKSAWPALACDSWNLWFSQVAQLHLSGHWVLTEAMTEALWQQVALQVQADSELPESLVEHARTAYDRLRLWCVQEGWEDGSSEADLLSAMINAYQEKLAEVGACDTITLLQKLALRLESEVIPIPDSVILLGFDDQPPLLQRLVAAMERCGAKVRVQNLEIASNTVVYGFADKTRELNAAFTWARELLTTGGKSEEPMRIGIVVPNLAAERQNIERELVKTFEPGYLAPGVGQHAPAYNLSAGQPLAQTPLVATALKFLRFCFAACPIHDVEELLLSPFLWPDLNLSRRVFLLNRLKEQYIELSLPAFSAFLARVAVSEGEDRFFRQVHQLLDCQKKCTARNHRQWLEHFLMQLELAGWPGERRLDTLEYQQYQSFADVCVHYSSLDQVLSVKDQAAELQRLSRLCYTPFLAQTTASPLQVLGVLEASALHFDALWVLGLTDAVWPEPCEPNPLLPVAMQKKHGLPRASIEREYDLAKRITQRFVNSASEVIFSFPEWSGDEPLRASPLLRKFLQKPAPSNLDSSDDFGHEVQAPLQWMDDAIGEKYSSAAAKVKGGATILKDQAACPFRAYARHRLLARNPDPLQPGVTALLRGNLLHLALEKIWSQLRSQRALISMEESALQHLIVEATAAAWAELNRGRLGARTARVELQRAERLLSAWLECEKLRAPFDVLSQEQNITGTVGPLSLNIRLDRLDQLGDGKTAVIDYKTGSTETKHWLGDRPDEPQVPLYSVLQADVVASAFAELSVKTVAAKGVTSDPTYWPGLQLASELKTEPPIESWQALLDHWRQTLEKLACDFYEGQAAVDPKHQAQTCRFCDLHNLCRVAQLQGGNDEAAS